MAPLLDHTPASLTEALGGPGRAREVFRSLARGADPHVDRSLAAGLRARLAERVGPLQGTERGRTVARDGTVKLLLEVEPGRVVESVLIPEARRTTLCVSSQVGCARGCAFCLTATMGLRKNLGAAGILAQVHRGLRVAREREMPPLRNLVFMGMGEPLDNWSAVHPALAVLLDGRGFGFGPRHVTVSTVGPSPRAVLSLSETPARVAWSLHAARDAVRSALIATARYPVARLRDAFASVLAGRKTALFVEMTLMRDVNDGEADADAALALFRDFPVEVRFNLLPMNPTGRGALEPSPPEAVERFAARLRAAGHFAMVRKARGDDESAACGQLVLGPTGPARAS